jgi:uncharacterized membrane protein
MKQRINNKLSISALLVQVLCICLLISIWLFTILTIVKSEGPIPSHFKIDGSVDGYSDNSWLQVILPVMSTGLYFLLMALIRVIPRLMLPSTSIVENKTERKQAAIKNILKGFQVLFLGQIFGIVLAEFLVVTKHIQKIPEFVFPSFLIGGGVLIILLIILAINDKGK